jgi:hypothetical protein
MPAVGKAATKVKIQKIVYTQPLLKLRLSLFERVFRKGDKMYKFLIPMDFRCPQETVDEGHTPMRTALLPRLQGFSTP